MAPAFRRKCRSANCLRLRPTNLASNHLAHSAPLALRANSQAKSSLLGAPAFFIKRERRRIWWQTETKIKTDSMGIQRVLPYRCFMYLPRMTRRYLPPCFVCLPYMTKVPASLRICLADSFSCCLIAALAVRRLGNWSAAACAGRAAADNSSAAMPSDIAKQPVRSRQDASQVSGQGCGSRSSSLTAHQVSPRPYFGPPKFTEACNGPW